MWTVRVLPNLGMHNLILIQDPWTSNSSPKMVRSKLLNAICVLLAVSLLSPKHLELTLLKSLHTSSLETKFWRLFTWTWAPSTRFVFSSFVAKPFTGRCESSSIFFWSFGWCRPCTWCWDGFYRWSCLLCDEQIRSLHQRYAQLTPDTYCLRLVVNGIQDAWARCKDFGFYRVIQREAGAFIS